MSNLRQRVVIAPGQILSAQSVRVSNESARVDVPHSHGEHEPTIELVMDGEFVQAIDVICVCGRRHRGRCLYENE